MRGSPPHTRGKVYHNTHAINWGRITPAHAGKSSEGIKNFSKFEDHPRTRGEKFVSTHRPICSKGSPPHTRGKVDERIHNVLRSRITPAHAGKSTVMLMDSETQRDHPRTRGEKA